MKLIPIIAVLMLLVCCTNDKAINQINQVVTDLNTVEKQAQFLEEIYEKDQGVRIFMQEQEQKFGRESNEYQLAHRNFMETDRVNFLEIEAYLKTYGHPTLENHGEGSVNTPWIVIHHAQGGIETRQRNFKYLYEGFKKGDLEGDRLTFLLNRMYREKFGFRIEWDRPYRTEEELDTLLKSLDLLEIVEKVDQKLTTHKAGQSIEEIIADLTSVEKQTQFLEELSTKDQAVRIFIQEQEQKFGWDSKEYQLAQRNFIETDSLNVLKIETYLKTYGHPTIEKHGKKATEAPWLVIHHNMDMGIRYNHFPYFYEAYKNGDLHENLFTIFLKRMHIIEYGSVIQWDKPYRTEEELDTLFKSLDLTEIVEELDSDWRQKQ